MLDDDNKRHSFFAFYFSNQNLNDKNEMNLIYMRQSEKVDRYYWDEEYHTVTGRVFGI